MTSDTQEYDIATIRQLLLAAFTPEELRRFCYDRPTFRPVVNRFGPGHGHDDMVDELIIYSEIHLLFDELLAEVKGHNPRQYARFFVPEPSDSEVEESQDNERGRPVPHNLAFTSARPTGETGQGRQTKADYRRAKISSWRKAIDNHDWQTPFGATVWYTELRPHLTPETVVAIERPRTYIVPAEGRGEPAVKYTLLDEVSRIEQLWDLI